MIKVLVSGACGRMGQAVVKAVMEDQELQLVAAVDIKTGIDAGEMVGMGKSGIIVTDNLYQARGYGRLYPPRCGIWQCCQGIEEGSISCYWHHRSF